jgi:hypothetical protein
MGLADRKTTVGRLLPKSLAKILRLGGDAKLPGGTVATGGQRGASEFPAALYSRLAAERPGNLFVSPFSIHTALAMVASGAAGETERQMVETLHLASDPAARAASLQALRSHLDEARTRSGITLDVANRAWVQKSYALLPSFTSGLEQVFGATMASADFVDNTEGVRREINSWVQDQTRGRIRDLLAPGGLPDLIATSHATGYLLYCKNDPGATSDSSCRGSSWSVSARSP